MHALWTEKYRPVKLSEYVFTDTNQEQQIKSWIKDGALPHLILSGPAGTGKTTLAKLLFLELDVNPYDILEINASRENSVDVIRHKITSFSGTMPFGDMKYVLLDEADFLSIAAQAVLRGVMETYHSSCRFILTCNYPTRIIPALHSRCQGFHIDSLNVTDFTARVAEICIAENVTFDLDTLDSYVQAKYPDMRKTINSVQQHSVNGVLYKVTSSSNGNDSSDWMIAAIELFKSGQYKAARETICSKARVEEYEDVYRFMYRNLELWGSNENQRNQAIVIIRNGMAKVPLVACPEINLAAVLVELEMNRQ